MSELFTRRAFLSALAASAVAAGASLPVGFPSKPVAPTQHEFVWKRYYFVHGPVGAETGVMTASHIHDEWFEEDDFRRVSHTEYEAAYARLKSWPV